LIEYDIFCRKPLKKAKNAKALLKSKAFAFFAEWTGHEPIPYIFENQ